MIAVGNSIKTISVEVSRYDEVGQTLWILLNNQKQKIRIGVIYGPQENITPNNKLKLLYKTIAEQIEIVKKISTSAYGRRFQCKDIKTIAQTTKKQYQKEEDSSKE